MAIPTSRTKVRAEIRINEDNCIGCGSCVSVCKDFGLIIENNKARQSDNPLFGCIACGHCMAICPSDAIRIQGRTLSPDDLFELSDTEGAATYEQLLSLLQRRRSIREFKDVPVDNELIERILEAAETAPMGLPPSDVNALVLKNKDTVRAFATDFCTYLEGIKWFVSNWFLLLMRPFWGKANSQLFKDFIKPLFQIYTENMSRGINLVNYDAPLAIYFYGSPYADPADPIIAATYAMIAAETLGLGTCMLGGVHPFIQNGRKAKLFRAAQGIRYRSREGLFVIFGHPDVEYKKGVRRTFASIDVRE
jgi:ferredoxin